MPRVKGRSERFLAHPVKDVVWFGRGFFHRWFSRTPVRRTLQQKRALANILVYWRRKKMYPVYPQGSNHNWWMRYFTHSEIGRLFRFFHMLTKISSQDRGFKSGKSFYTYLAILYMGRSITILYAVAIPKLWGTQQMPFTSD